MSRAVKCQAFFYALFFLSHSLKGRGAIHYKKTPDD